MMTQRKLYSQFREAREAFSEMLAMYVLCHFALLELVNGSENGEIPDDEKLLRAAMESQRAADALLDFKRERLGDAEPELPQLDRFILQGGFNWRLYHMYCAMYHSGRNASYGDIAGIYEMYYTGTLVKDMVSC